MQNSVTSELSEDSIAARQRRTIIAATVGNVLEIYDFLAFAIFAVPISRAFFPAGDEYVALMLTFMTFAAGFVVRPLGAFILGRYADRVGRKRALSFTLLMMAFGTLVPAICPTYQAIGLAAPIILVLGRLIQGFSAGGEIGSNVAMLIESASKSNRVLFSSFQQVAQGGGVLVAGIIGLCLTQYFGDQKLLADYWRIAFLAGLLIGPVGWYIRRAIPETPEFERAAATGRQTTISFVAGIRTNSGRILIGIAIMVFWTVAAQVSNYFTTYAVRELHLPLLATYVGQIASGATLVVVCPIVGAFADKVGPFKPMAWGSALAGILAYPLFWILASHPSLGMLVTVQSIISLFLGLYAACAPLVISDIFPTHYRATGVGTSYALGVSIFGGLTPLIVTSLIHASGDKLIIGVYLSAAALLSLALIAFLARRKPR
ncbi:MFS transporter [Chitinasiproducens palmae]|uniref:MFS transporter, MHS family, proline/betaine transporter n=1 Tax=Chitinasiproducens palmae TaxID=1770053 RepID=A0A1H2PM61_9BURK|nr:MFS transporter [Chitinasiproducens palmae]SDV47190.1 MFS transporter, MHS family, proline/betaine transporter [Chitinasiproducens palmae]